MFRKAWVDVWVVIKKDANGSSTLPSHSENIFNFSAEFFFLRFCVEVEVWAKETREKTWFI